MGFLQSAINQVGRDLGRVVSNTVFRDRHAIPIRRAPSLRQQEQQQQNVQPAQPKARPIQEVKDEFDRAIDFKTSYKPNTLIAKLINAFIVIKNEARAFIDDGYLDINESQELFDMLKRFNHKVSDVDDVMSFTEAEDSKYYDQLNSIVLKTKAVFAETLQVSVKACKERATTYEELATDDDPIGFWRYVGLHLIWMPKYANGGEKNTTRAVIANILDLVTCTFLLTRLVLLILGLTEHGSYKRKIQTRIEMYQRRAAQERQRARVYQSFIQSNT